MSRLHLNEEIKYLAFQEWGSVNLKRIRIKPESIRYKCPCGQERALLEHRILYDMENHDIASPTPIKDVNNVLIILNYISVFMSLCGCGRVNYWVEWPDEDEVHRQEKSILLKICENELKSLS